MNNGTRHELSQEIVHQIVYRLVQQRYGEKRANALTIYVFEVLEWKTLTYQGILDRLESVVVCDDCDEATEEQFAVHKEDLESEAITGIGYLCDYCAKEYQ